MYSRAIGWGGFHDVKICNKLQHTTVGKMNIDWPVDCTLHIYVGDTSKIEGATADWLPHIPKFYDELLTEVGF